MAVDASQKRFRHDGVWFEFKMLDLGTALLPVEKQGGGCGDYGEGEEDEDDDDDDDEDDNEDDDDDEDDYEDDYEDDDEEQGEQEEEQVEYKVVVGKSGRILGFGPIITICR
ncbi:hypothetical protein DL770_010349 [Monosporascus sp. CRB-9-2]|nr:hypothetical protein DL770_010349 [Monosporascus sp. CRB-9-2]